MNHREKINHAKFNMGVSQIGMGCTGALMLHAALFGWFFLLIPLAFLGAWLTYRRAVWSEVRKRLERQR